MATSESRAHPPSQEDGLRDHLATLLNIHRLRHPKSDFAKIIIGLQPRTESEDHYRYYEDTHCIRRLDQETVTRLKDKYVQNGDLELVDAGKHFLSLKHANPCGRNDVKIIESLLEDAHDASLEDAAYIGEVVEDTTYLPLKALYGVSVVAETNHGP